MAERTVRDPHAKHDPEIRAALHAQVDTVPWTTVTGPDGDSLHAAFVEHDGQRYTLLRDEHGTLLVYDEHEWACFLDGVRHDEF
ncbi:MAG: DUF397 domain-containing protein [Sciscionella sp.]